MKVTLPELVVAGQARKGRVVATANGGMNAELFGKCLELCMFPCHPLMSPTEQCAFFWDGDESHMLRGEKSREHKERGAIIIPPKPNTTTDTAGCGLVSFPVVRVVVIARFVIFLLQWNFLNTQWLCVDVFSFFLSFPPPLFRPHPYFRNHPDPYIFILNPRIFLPFFFSARSSSGCGQTAPPGSA
jgi:hypothetical protein